MQKLIIYLSDDDAAQPLTEEAGLARDKDVIVIVPSEDILLTRAALPKMSRSRLVQALPFALEEQLISDPDTLHFASVTKNNEEFAVAVIAKEKFQCWLAQLSAWKIKPDQLLPSCLALTYEESTWHVVLHADKALARTGHYQGFACERQNLGELLQLALTTSAALPQEILVHNYTSQAIAAELRLAIAVREEMLPTENFIAALAQNQMNFADMNLLQGIYASKSGKRTPAKQLITVSAAMLAVWAVLLFLYPAVSYFMLKQRLTYINSGIAQIYKRHFPTAANIVAPRMRLEEKLHKLTGGVSEDRFLLLLGSLSHALTESAGINLKRFDYQNNQLNLEITAGASEEVGAFATALANKGLKVKQQNASLNGARVNATMVVE